MMPIRIGLSDNRQIELTGESFCIGRDPACEVRLADDPRVKPRHAVVRRTAGRWMVEATDGNMIQVGTEPPAAMRWINPGDVIRLTPAGPELTFQPPPAAGGSAPGMAATSPATSARAGAVETVPVPVAPAPASVPTPAADRAASLSSQPALWALGGGGLVVCGLVMGLILLWASGVFHRGDGPAAIPAGEPVINPNETADSKGPESKPVVNQAGAAVEAERALYLVIMKNPAQGQTYQLGTAWSVGKHHLVTSAAIVIAMEELRDVAPKSAVLSPLVKNELPVVSIKAHPAYRKAVADAKAAQAESEAVRLELEQNKDEEKIESLTEKVVAADERRFQALDRQVDYDVGLIEIASELPSILRLAPAAGAELKAGSKLTLAGIPFLRDEYLVDMEALSQPVKAPGSILARMELTGGAGSPGHRLLIKCRGETSPQQNWSGSPVMNSAGQVIAIYSRPTPPLDGQPAKSMTSHDTAGIERVREMMPAL